jgi:ELWxxDGT repeat protein
VGNYIYFSAYTEDTGFELWRSDGTEAGTFLVKDIWPGTQGSTPMYLVSFKGKVFFSADDASYGREWWMSDGTEAGTRLLKDIQVGAGTSVPS